MTSGRPSEGGRPSPKARLFYDGECGLCHRSVRFVLARDPDGSRFRFASLGSPVAKRLLEARIARDLPDSLILQLPAGELLFRSDAVIGILERLTGIWPVLGHLLRRCPKRLRDALYDSIARIRGRLFAPPPNACPVIDPALVARFDDAPNAPYASE